MPTAKKRAGKKTEESVKTNTPEEVLRRISAERLAVNDQGQKKRMSAQEVMLRRLGNAAIKGDLRAISSVLKLAEAHLVPEAPGQYRIWVVADESRGLPAGSGWWLPEYQQKILKIVISEDKKEEPKRKSEGNSESAVFQKIANEIINIRGVEMSALEAVLRRLVLMASEGTPGAWELLHRFRGRFPEPQNQQPIIRMTENQARY